MPIILVLGRLREEDCEFKASLGYIARPSLKKPNQKKKVVFGISFVIFP
jgi:hypothetical protein